IVQDGLKKLTGAIRDNHATQEKGRREARREAIDHLTTEALRAMQARDEAEKKAAELEAKIDWLASMAMRRATRVDQLTEQLHRIPQVIRDAFKPDSTKKYFTVVGDISPEKVAEMYNKLHEDLPTGLAAVQKPATVALDIKVPDLVLDPV